MAWFHLALKVFVVVVFCVAIWTWYAIDSYRIEDDDWNDQEL